MNRMSKKKNKDIQIQNPDITSKALVMNLDFFSSKNIGTVFNKTKKEVNKSKYESSNPPNNKNRYHKEKLKYCNKWSGHQHSSCSKTHKKTFNINL